LATRWRSPAEFPTKRKGALREEERPFFAGRWQRSTRAVTTTSIPRFAERLRAALLLAAFDGTETFKTINRELPGHAAAAPIRRATLVKYRGTIPVTDALAIIPGLIADEIKRISRA
jgi:hypothetical protein